MFATPCIPMMTNTRRVHVHHRPRKQSASAGAAMAIIGVARAAQPQRRITDRVPRRSPSTPMMQCGKDAADELDGCEKAHARRRKAQGLQAVHDVERGRDAEAAQREGGEHRPAKGGSPLTTVTILPEVGGPRHLRLDGRRGRVLHEEEGEQGEGCTARPCP